jgi:hypothetical protein
MSARAGSVDVERVGDCYRALVTHPCGHVFTANKDNTPEQARAHGEILLTRCVCGVCRKQRHPGRRRIRAR